ncbi:MAG: AAA-type ATPase lid domain-containing protein, partial [Isosphaeraceae bacterium]
AVARLESAHWTGNVRELQNAIERAVVVKAGGPINVDDLGIASVGVAAATPIGGPISFRDARDDFERAYFARLLEISGGNISEAARLSGLARQNFYVHVEHLGLLDKS